MTDPGRFSDENVGEASRIFRSLRDDAPPPDLKARTLASLKVLPPPAPPEPPPAPPAAPGGWVPGVVLQKAALGLALLGLLGATLFWSLRDASPRAATPSIALLAASTSPATSSPPGGPRRDDARLPGSPARAARSPGDPGSPLAAVGSADPASLLAPAGSADPTSPLDPAALAASAAPTTPPGDAPAGGPPSASSAEASSAPSALAQRAPGTGPMFPGGSPGDSPAGRRSRSKTTEPAAAAPAASASSDASPAASAPPDPKALSRQRLEKEVAQLDRVSQAIAAGDGNRALGLIAQYRQMFGDGQLSTEAAAMEIQALFLAGDRANATRLAAIFLASHPRSPHVSRVRALCPSCAAPEQKKIP